MEKITVVKNITDIVQNKEEEDIIHEKGNKTTYSKLTIENSSDEDIKSINIHATGSVNEENNYTEDIKMTNSDVKDKINYVNGNLFNVNHPLKEVDKNTNQFKGIWDTHVVRIQVKDEMKTAENAYLCDSKISKNEMKGEIINEGLADNKPNQDYLSSEVKEVTAWKEIRNDDFHSSEVEVKKVIKTEENNFVNILKTVKIEVKEVFKTEMKKVIINEVLVDNKPNQNYLPSEVKSVMVWRKLSKVDVHIPEDEVKTEIKSKENNYLNGFKSVTMEVKGASIKDEDDNTNKNHMINLSISDEMEGVVYEHDNINNVRATGITKMSDKEFNGNNEKNVSVKDSIIDEKTASLLPLRQPTHEKVMHMKDNITEKIKSECESDKNDMKGITINCTPITESHILHKDPIEKNYNMQVPNEVELSECFPVGCSASKDHLRRDIKLLQKPIVVLVDLKYGKSPSSKRTRGIKSFESVNETIEDNGETEKTQHVEDSSESESYFDIDEIEVDENGFFKCLLCSFKTVYKHSLINHQLTHSSKRPFTCDQCEFKTKRKYDLQVHEQKHKQIYPYKCNLCNYKGKARSNFVSHMQQHTAPDSLRCLICDKGFSTKGNLTAHIKYIHNEPKRSFSCELCNFTATKKNALTFHINVVHKKVQMFRCTTCPYSTARKGDLARHSMNHTGTKPYGCPQCSFKTTNSGTLKNHMRVHTGERPFSCSLCNKKFKMKGTLNEHMVWHTGLKEFHCSKCDFETTSAKLLKNHLLKHTDEKPHKCPSCSYSSKTASGLNTHRKFHSGKFISCEHCDYKTPFLLNMRSHIQTHEGARPFKCDLCDFESRSKSHLEGHLEKEHQHSKNKSKKKCTPKDRDFPCDICSYRTVSFGYLRNHVQLKHGIKDF